ncbi:unnamed protein product, partial [Iphiclides podalirius]
MESPVRILIGAAVTVHLLLLTSTAVNGSALPNDTFPTTVKDEKVSNFGHLNGTRTINDRVKTLDIALNELHPKDSTSEEHTENNIKYKDRGRVRFHSQLKSSTESPLRRIRLSPVTSNIVEVTPASDVKKLFKTMDSTQKDKPTIAPILASSTSTVTSMPLSAEKESDKIDSDEEEDEDDDEYDHYRSTKDHESDFFTIPGYNDDEKKYNRIKEELNTPSFDKYSSFFSKDTYSSQESKNDGPYKLHNFFDFDSDLTTPKNDFFDQKYHDISSSIMKNLASIKTKSPPANATNTQKIIKENVGFEKLSNGSPNNKSTVIIKNTKETRLLDNEQAGSVNSELSDVHDPVLQSDVSGVKKVVQSQVISDNMIPSLWKRGSMKFTTTSAAPTVVETGISDLEIPPTMTAWALASLRSPPSSSSAVGNVSVSTQKSVDENELQKVSEVVDNKETITAPTTTISINSGALSNDVSNNVTEMDQNKLPWKPITSINDISDEKEIVTRSERLPAESNISIQSSLKPSNSTQVPQKISKIATETIESNELKPLWIPAMINPDVTTTEETVVSEKDNIQPVDATKSTGFESITKLPSGVTTPTDENDSTVTQQSEIETTPNLEITTIRLLYVPPEDATEETEASSTSENWRSAIPTRTMPTTFDDSPITTYRPKYTTTSVIGEETTAIFIDTTPQLEISSQIIEDATHGSSGTSTKPTTEAFNRNQPATTDLPSTTVTDCEETTYETTSTTTIQTELITEKIREIMDIKETTENPEAFKTTDESTLHIQTDSRSEENSDSNEVILQDTTETPTTTPSSIPSTSTITEDFAPNTSAFPLTTTTLQTTTNGAKENDAQPKLNVVTTQQSDETTAYTTEMTTKSISELEDLTSYAEDVTTESSSRVLTEEAGSGAAIAIAVSTIGVIALVLLLGLLQMNAAVSLELRRLPIDQRSLISG